MANGAVTRLEHAPLSCTPRRLATHLFFVDARLTLDLQHMNKQYNEYTHPGEHAVCFWARV